MLPSDAQTQALTALEKLGGKPVVLRENAELPNQARIHVAAAAEPAHVLTYNPAATAELPYLVCFQCGLAERALRSARDERFNVASTPETYSRVQALVRKKKTIPDGMVATYSQMITDGLGVQLRSMPVGIRLDRMLYQAHPELRGMHVNAGRKVQRGAGSPGGRKVQRTTVHRCRSGESRRSRDFPLPRVRHEECMQRWRCGPRSAVGF